MATTIRPYVDTATGDVRCFQIVRDTYVIADGIATHQDAEDRMREMVRREADPRLIKCATPWCHARAMVGSLCSTCHATPR